MNSREINDRIIEIKTKIGTVRTTRNLNTLCTGVWALCAGMNGTLAISEQSPLCAITAGLNLTLVGLYGLKTYQKQKELNALSKEEEELLIKKGAHTILGR